MELEPWDTWIQLSWLGLKRKTDCLSHPRRQVGARPPTSQTSLVTVQTRDTIILLDRTELLCGEVTSFRMAGGDGHTTL